MSSSVAVADGRDMVGQQHGQMPCCMHCTVRIFRWLMNECTVINVQILAVGHRSICLLRVRIESMTFIIICASLILWLNLGRCGNTEWLDRRTTASLRQPHPSEPVQCCLSQQRHRRQQRLRTFRPLETLQSDTCVTNEISRCACCGLHRPACIMNCP